MGGRSPQPQWDFGVFNPARVLRTWPSARWFLGLQGWFKWAEQSVASAHRRLHEVNSTSFKVLGEKNASSFAIRCCAHTRVLNIESHMHAPILETVHGQVLHAIPVVLRKSADSQQNHAAAAWTVATGARQWLERSNLLIQPILTPKDAWTTSHTPYAAL